MTSLENNNNTKEITEEQIPTSEKPTVKIDTKNLANLATDINTTDTTTDLAKLQKKTPSIKSTKENNNTDDNISESVVNNIANLAVLAGADEKNVTKIKEIVNKDSGIGKFLSKTWSTIKPFIPKFILDFFSDEKNHDIGSTTASKTPQFAQKVKKEETKEVIPEKSKIETEVGKLMILQTKTAISRMFKGSISPPMKEKFIIPNSTTYQKLQAELELKSSETVHGGDTEKSPTHKGTYILMKLLEDKFPNMFKYSAAVNDDFHHDKIKYHSKHTDGVAFDYSLKKGSLHIDAFDKVTNFLKELGLNTSELKNEYAKLSAQGTAGHLHFQFTKNELDQVYNAYANNNKK